jgi:hypothetical protein
MSDDEPTEIYNEKDDDKNKFWSDTYKMLNLARDSVNSDVKIIITIDNNISELTNCHISSTKKNNKLSTLIQRVDGYSTTWYGVNNQ